MYPERNFYPNRQYIPKPTTYGQGHVIYVNPTITMSAGANKVLVNPNFSRQVHVNPNFAAKATKTVFVNPNVFNQNQSKSVTTVAQQTTMLPKAEPQAEPIRMATHSKSKYKKINNPIINANSDNNIKLNDRLKVINTKTKLVRVPSTNLNVQSAVALLHVSPMKTPKNRPKRIITRHKLIKINSPNIKRNLTTIVKSKYKIINTNGAQTASRFKLDNRKATTASPYKTKKAYMMRLNPQNMIIKNKNIFKLVRRVKNNKKLDNRTAINNINGKDKLKKTPTRKTKHLVKINRKKLKKCNIPCEIFNKKGKCRGLANGKCTKKHDLNQIQICIWFLQGICRDDKCTLSHKASPEKMPTCKFYLEGMCHKDKGDCPYLHIKLSKDAPVCVDFLHGYCSKGLECDKRHQFLCPDYERDGKCAKKLCRYPHGKAVRQYRDTLLRVIARNTKAKPKTTKPEKRKIEQVENSTTSEDTKRYYQCEKTEDVGSLEQKETDKIIVNPSENVATNEEGNKEIVSVFDRPKLGTLPSFISL